jgi:hypothetical protein
MIRVMTLVIGLGLTAAGGLVGLTLGQRAEAVRLDTDLVQRQQDARAARHEEWVGLLERRRKVLPAEYARQATFALAAADTQRHLRVDLAQGLMMLVEDGYVVREISVQVGDPLPADGDRAAVDIIPGKRIIDQRIRDGQFDMPEWASWSGERPKNPRRRSRRKRRRKLPKAIDGLYGARTMILDDGTVLYSTPGWGPWASDASVRPGGVEMSFTDMASVFGAVSTGAHVYVY